MGLISFVSSPDHRVCVCVVVVVFFERLFYAITVVVASIVMLRLFVVFFSRHSVLRVWYGHSFIKNLI